MVGFELAEAGAVAEETAVVVDEVAEMAGVEVEEAAVEEEGFDIVEVIRYLARRDKPVGHGHVLADLNGLFRPEICLIDGIVGQNF